METQEFIDRIRYTLENHGIPLTEEANTWIEDWTRERAGIITGSDGDVLAADLLERLGRMTIKNFLTGCCLVREESQITSWTMDSLEAVLQSGTRLCE